MQFSCDEPATNFEFFKDIDCTKEFLDLIAQPNPVFYFHNLLCFLSFFAKFEIWG